VPTTTASSEPSVVDLLEDSQDVPLGDLITNDLLDAVIKRIVPEAETPTLDVAAFGSSI
jgi:hypothetical protein